MAKVHDVAAYILARTSDSTAMKLQKLVYYSQAWSLVWDDAPLFEEVIEAWANGPVVPELYRLHRGRFTVSEWPHGHPDALTESQRDTVDAVLEFYGKMTPAELSDLTHRETPWQEARKGLAPGQRGTNEIPITSLLDYYGQL